MEHLCLLSHLDRSELSILRVWLNRNPPSGQSPITLAERQLNPLRQLQFRSRPQSTGHPAMWSYAHAKCAVYSGLSVNLLFQY